MATKFIFRQLQGNEPKYYTFLCMIGLVGLIGGFSAYHMETHGHHVTGMNNHVVWGIPHVFAIFLILAASGALNVASISSCLLYTSPSPRDQRGSRMPSSA